jgi:hypothetical protein
MKYPCFVKAGGRTTAPAQVSAGETGKGLKNTLPSGSFLTWVRWAHTRPPADARDRDRAFRCNLFCACFAPQKRISASIPCAKDGHTTWRYPAVCLTFFNEGDSTPPPSLPTGRYVVDRKAVNQKSRRGQRKNKRALTCTFRPEYGFGTRGRVRFTDTTLLP